MRGAPQIALDDGIRRIVAAIDVPDRPEPEYGVSVATAISELLRPVAQHFDIFHFVPIHDNHVVADGTYEIHSWWLQSYPNPTALFEGHPSAAWLMAYPHPLPASVTGLLPDLPIASMSTTPEQTIIGLRSLASAYERRVRLIGEIGRQQDSEPLDDLRRELLADIVPLGAELNAAATKLRGEIYAVAAQEGQNVPDLRQEVDNLIAMIARIARVPQQDA